MRNLIYESIDMSQEIVLDRLIEQITNNDEERAAIKNISMDEKLLT